MANDQPKGLKADKGIELLTWGTPNGWKASIMLEELKEAYGKDYTWQGINISTNVQKEPWFTKLGPNGRIPVIVDHDQGGFAVQEGLCMCPSVPRESNANSLCQQSSPTSPATTIPTTSSASPTPWTSRALNSGWPGNTVA
jgi:glutathione S-transferase